MELKPQQTEHELLPIKENPDEIINLSHLYRNSVISVSDERMRQLAEHFSP